MTLKQSPGKTSEFHKYLKGCGISLSINEENLCIECKIQRKDSEKVSLNLRNFSRENIGLGTIKLV